MRIEIINTGSELLLGRVLNTHQQWLCRKLSDLGYLVHRQTAVPDTGPDIQSTVREALGRSDLVIVTGGLGPTSDDCTRELVAELLHRKLKRDETVWQDILEFFAKRNRTPAARTEVQAMVPEGATVLRNRCGTAPGLVLTISAAEFQNATRDGCLVMLPGPPNELRPMFNEQVVPLVQRLFPLAEAFICRTLLTTGLGESLAENAIAQPLAALVAAGLELGYCARPGEVDIRLGARGAQAATLIAEAEQIVRRQIGEYVFGVDDEDLPAVVIRLLTARRQTLAVAESCTGGGLGHRLTNVPGASEVFAGGAISYSNAVKESLLGVKAETLAAHGAVSEPVAREMALGAQARLGADYAISITGIAGPGGGTASKPVGTVFIGLASPGRVEIAQRLNPQEREMFKYVTTQQALELLRQELVK